MIETSLSPFLYSTCSLSVINSLIEFEGGSPEFKKDSTYLFLLYEAWDLAFLFTGLLPSLVPFSTGFKRESASPSYSRLYFPCSLVITYGISVDLFKQLLRYFNSLSIWFSQRKSLLQEIYLSIRLTVLK